MAVSMTHDPLKNEYESLPIEIRAATRSCHYVLNHAIVSRLPLCLPPHAATPSLYAGGIACFGRIYFLFEHAWEEILTGRPGSVRIRDALKQLKLPSLFRTARLKADLSLFDQRLRGLVDSLKEEDVQLEALLDRLKEDMVKRPHLIMSYAWVMYLALFNGGRWIRAQLEQAGPAFWGMQAHTQSSKMDALSFWEFEGDFDGEDIKDDFKARFNTAAAVMDDIERQDIVDGCVRLFDNCSQIVGWLDNQTQSASDESVVP